MPKLTMPRKDAMNTKEKIIYWHRELPPLDAEAVGEYVVEATSARVPGTLAHRDELWNQCFEDLMTQVRARLEQEVVRLGGAYAHVLNESVDSKHDDRRSEAWLHGRFTYMLYRRPSHGDPRSPAIVSVSGRGKRTERHRNGIT